MTKKEKKVVWVVTLPNGKKQEIDEAVARKYFLGDVAATPFSHLSLGKVVRLRPVTVQPPAPRTPLSTSSKPRASKGRGASPRSGRAQRLQRLRTTVRSSRYAAARRIKKS